MHKKFLRAVIIAGLTVLCLARPAAASVLIDFGDPNAARLWSQFSALERGTADEPARILQLGDSHTGGDYFTQALRERLQQRFGNAGIGWLTPGYVKNQRSAQALMRMSGQWKTRVSHGELDNFPLGGVVSQAAHGASMEIAPKMPLNGLLRVSIWSRRPANSTVSGWTLTFPDGEVRDLPAPTGSDWQVSYVIGNALAANSLFLHPSGNPPELGGIAVDAISPGVTVDALGIVGATQKVINQWQPEAIREQLGWRQPDLLILAYGTNEAFDTKFDTEAYRAELHKTIRQLREAAPHAAILMVGAPNAGKKTGRGERRGCKYDLPPALHWVQTIQRQVAEDERLMYWDWAAAMGGVCAMQLFAETNPPLARPDLIHFTEEGYLQSGASLFNALMDLYKKNQ